MIARRLSILIAFLVVAGCVDRRLTIVSDPPGALVTVNNRDIGAAPVDVPSELFVYDGVYDIVLKKDGYETLHVRQELRPPWYLRFPLDFFAEVVWPFTIPYRQELVYQLQPPRAVSREALLQSAEEFRNYGQQIGTAPALPGPQP
jgi:hypothetical protein